MLSECLLVLSSRQAGGECDGKEEGVASDGEGRGRESEEDGKKVERSCNQMMP